MADLAQAEQAAKSFAQAHAGTLASLSGAALAAAIAEYEQIQEILGRVASYAQLLFAGDSTDPGDRPLLPDGERAGDRDQQRPDLLHAGAQPPGRRGAGGQARRPGAGALPPVAARPAGVPAAPAERRTGKADARARPDRERRLGAAVRRNRRGDADRAERRDPDRQRHAEQAVRPRPLGARGRRQGHRQGVRRQHPAVLADHQHPGQGQGDRGHLAPPRPPDQLPQPRQHGGGRGRRCAGDRGARVLSPPVAPLLPDEGQVARSAEAAALGPQRAAAERRRPADRVAGCDEAGAGRLWRVQPGTGLGRPAVLRQAVDRRPAEAGQVRRRVRPSDGAQRASVSAAELSRQDARRDDAGA